MEFSTQTIPIYVLLIGQIIAIVIAIRKPNEDQNLTIGILKEQLKDLSGHSSELTKTYQNDLHSVHEEMRGLRDEIKTMSNLLTRLDTTVNERIPLRKNN